MAMAVDNRQQPQLSSMGYEHMRYPQQQPHFTNPWVSTGASQQQLYQTTVAPNVDAQRPTSIAIPYHGLPVTAPPMGQGITLPDGTFGTQNLLDASEDLMSRYPTGYTTSGSPPNQTYAPTSAPYSQVEYGNTERSPYAYQQDASRRSSHPSVPSIAFYESVESAAQRQRQSSLVDFSRMNTQQPRNSFSDALDASRGMVSLS